MKALRGQGVVLSLHLLLHGFAGALAALSGEAWDLVGAVAEFWILVA